MPRNFLVGSCFWLAVVFCGLASDALQREMPRPLPGHPGNIFLAEEEIIVPVPPGDSETWRVLDYDGRVVAEGRVENGRAAVGRLAVGYYEVARAAERSRKADRTSLAVLAVLRAPTPLTSPIGLDVAMAWFYREEQMPAVASLCALAGVNWVRDRLNWGELEPQQGRFAAATRYDNSATIQRAAGLQVLQVNHLSPAWANPDTKRFPPDLRDTFHFHREMARRWRGQVAAFEPWNEADIPLFGGHTGSEMASLQKAAYLGLKAGNPKVIVCLNVFAEHRAATLSDLAENSAWPYFDTFNLHHYEPFDAYQKLYAEFRAVSAGKPLWVTECNLPVKWSGDEKLKEPSEADLRVQAERVAAIYAQTLYEGAQAVFYFLLPHYVEGQTQFGLLRPDLTPRPAYVALAAVGRLLADATPRGALKSEDPAVRGFVFRARPDGRTRTVLVGWAGSGERRFPLPRAPEAVFDHLGREQSVRGTLVTLGTAPVFAVLREDTRLALLPPPKPPARLSGKPSPVVFQAVLPPERVILKESGYRFSTDRCETVPVFAYSFSGRTVKGTLRTSGPPGWRVETPAEITLRPGERAEIPLNIDGRGVAAARQGMVCLEGEFGVAGRAQLSLRFVSDN